jgi:curved DNA-binding protein CbpA
VSDASSPSPSVDLEHLAAWADVLDEATYYEILGVLHIADAGAIRDAFHEFALAFHPDAQLDLAPEERQIVAHVFQRGVEAYRVLSVEDERAKYDLALAKGLLRLEGASERRPTGARSLDELCTSAAAKLHAKRAEDLITRGELGRAADELLRALRAEEGPNADLAERLHAVNALARLAARPDEP